MQEQERKILSALSDELEKELHLPVTQSSSHEDLYLMVLRHITFLLENDFHQLILLLYRLDVSEEKLKTLLAEQPYVDAAQLITALILERLSLKVKTRQQYNMPDPDPADPEKW